MQGAPDGTAVLRLMADDPTEERARPVKRRFNQMITAFERVRARYAVCGAVAMGAHGARRFTEDIDVFVAAEDLVAVLATLSRSMRELRREPPEGSPFHVRLRSRRARGPAGVDVDLLVPIDAAEAWALETAVRGRALGRKFDVISPEALIVLKLRAYLGEPEGKGAQHRWDAIRVLREVPIDLDELRRFVRDSPPLAAELERVLQLPPGRGRSG